AADSARMSVLIVPSLVIGRAEGRFWLTRIGRASDAAQAGATTDPASASSAATDTALPPIVPRGQPVRAELHPGALSPEGYRQAVAEGVSRIRAGELGKVVIARDLVGRIRPGADTRPLITALAEGYPDCWTFAIDGFVGSSPETL